MAQLYEQELKTQEKAKEEHIKQAKEKAIEEQRVNRENQLRIEEEQQLEAERQKKIDTENEAKRDVYQPNTNGAIGTDWSTVSPEIASQYMSARTGVPASKWLDVIYKESSGNPYAENSLTCWGYLQIMQSVHGQVSNLSPKDYLDKAVSIYQSSGGTAWATW